MKKIFFNIIAFALTSTFCVKASAQATINYSSNNGKYITVNNTKVYYEEYGKGTPLLMLHSGFFSINNFQYSIPELSKYYRVIAIDLPGCGRSQQPDSMSFQLLADYASKTPVTSLFYTAFVLNT